MDGHGTDGRTDGRTDVSDFNDHIEETDLLGSKIGTFIR